MTLDIEGVWKEGKIVPLKKLELKEGALVHLRVMEKKPKASGSLMDLAGVWKDDDDTYTIFKKVYNERQNFKLRQCQPA
ncbi:MAG TPA: antitoxin AF2212-like protein [Candidatus Nanoarchaeia archaeon]|nr:antitoxin AF2212-like protein [Candidatus Nanoarchaeia archaeon]